MKVDINESVFRSNDETAEKVRKSLGGRGLKAVNIMASPGAGKTSVILQLLASMPADVYKGVIEGDVASRVDSEKIIKAGFPAVQINTDGGCHLTSSMVEKALEKLSPDRKGYVFIENIGNLICPTEFDLGETVRLVISSVPEGDDKPLKYPHIFSTADIVVVNKADLLPVMDFDLKHFTEGIRAVNQKAPIIPVSCRTGEGVGALVERLKL